MNKRALVTGITGQDGFFLSKILSNNGYEVLGTSRSAVSNFHNYKVIQTDYSKESLKRIITDFRPDEIYHLAGQTYVGKSWKMIHETIHGCAIIGLNLIELIGEYFPAIKIFNSSSSEIFAPVEEILTECTAKEPTTPYGCAKMFSHSMVKAYRENQNIFAVNGILFNHESHLRQKDFFSQKLVSGVVDIIQGRSHQLLLGNLDIIRDWGSAEEYMSAVFSIMQLKEPTDFNICSGNGVSVLEIVENAFRLANLNAKDFIAIDSNLVRNKEKKIVVGSHVKLTKLTGWKPVKSIHQIIEDMFVAELKRRGINETVSR